MRARQMMTAVGLALVAVGGCGAGAGTGEETTEVSSELTFGFPDQIGVFRNGTWYLDASGNNAWDGTPTDALGAFGQAGDIPVTPKTCNPYAGTKQIFITRGNSLWAWSFNDFVYNGGDQAFTFGFAFGPMMPVMLDRHIAAVGSDGQWLWDIDDDHVFGTVDRNFKYGKAGDIPVAGNIGTGGITVPGTFRNGLWIVDSNNNHIEDAGDAQFSFGGAGDWPVVADFNTGRSGEEIAVFRAGLWYVDYNGNRGWDGVSGGDRLYNFGGAGDIPVVASSRWTVDGCVH